MSLIKESRVEIVKTDAGHVQTYIFERQEGPLALVKRKARISRGWQILPSICACFACVPFGIMLGWPSPTYMVLLSEESPLPITMVQGPMIAGFLLFGTIFATPFSSSYHFGTKYSILCGLIVQTIGWVIMWQAQNIFYLLSSRFIIGLGNGYGAGQVRCYIREMCELDVARTLLKSVNLFMFLGLLIAYCMGPFVDFRTFSLATVLITVFIFFMCFFLPHSAGQYYKFNKLTHAKQMIKRTKPKANPTEELAKFDNVEEDLTIIRMFRTSGLRGRIATLFVLTFTQQFCGVPATLVYCQFLFREFQVPQPQYCAIFYGCVYLCSNAAGVFYTTTLNKKYVLLASCFSVVALLVTNITTIYYELNVNYWRYTPLLVMTLYVIVHTLGLGTVPFTMPEYLFPKKARKAAAHLHFMFFCLFAVIITKLFQVFYSALLFDWVFCLFASTAALGFVFVAIFIPAKPIED